MLLIGNKSIIPMIMPTWKHLRVENSLKSSSIQLRDPNPTHPIKRLKMTNTSSCYLSTMICNNDSGLVKNNKNILTK